MEYLRDYSARLDGVRMTISFMQEFLNNACKNGVRINQKNMNIILNDLMTIRTEIADGLDPSTVYLKFSKDNKFLGVILEKQQNKNPDV